MCNTILLGDFNYCLKGKKMNKLSEMLDTQGYTQLINTPTRVTTNTASLIDHIYTNNRDKVSQAGVIETGISDHFITYCTRRKPKDIIGKHTTIKIRSMKNYTKESFVENLEGKDWNIVKQERQDPDILGQPATSVVHPPSPRTTPNYFFLKL